MGISLITEGMGEWSWKLHTLHWNKLHMGKILKKNVNLESSRKIHIWLKNNLGVGWFSFPGITQNPTVSGGEKKKDYVRKILNLYGEKTNSIEKVKNKEHTYLIQKLEKATC